MGKLLTFIVPLKHPDSSRHWEEVIQRLQETVRSIESACNTVEGVSAILVANSEAELPDLPSCFEVLRVSYPPPNVSVFYGEGPDSERKNAVYWDKGKKVARGAIRAQQLGSQYIMSVDADDSVHKEIPRLVKEGSGAPGWFVKYGWLLPVGSRWGLELTNFNEWCGTFSVVRTDLLELGPTPEEMEPEVVRDWLGSHRTMIPALAKKGHQLQPFPIRAAVYRTGHPESARRREGLYHQHFKVSKLFKKPKNYIALLRKLRYFSNGDVKAFFGR